MIFLDMDGVLCDFVSAAYRVHGQTFDPATYPPETSDIVDVLGVTQQEFWQRIHAAGESFWSDLEPYPWTAELARELQHLDRVVIATSPSRDPSSYSGKRRWLQKMGLGHLDSMYGTQKWLMAKRARWLVDDATHNVNRWFSAGGHGVLVPQPWNHLPPTANTVASICDQIAQHPCFPERE